MGMRTYMVKSAGRRPAGEAEDLYNKNIDIGGVISFPDGEYSNNSRGVYPRVNDYSEVVESDDLYIEGEYKDEKIGAISSIPTDPPAGPVKPDAVDTFGEDEYPADPEKTNTARNMRIAAAGMDAVGGIINAYAKHQNFVTANNMKIIQAKQIQNQVRADAARAIVREGTKANERKGQALISAIAQGQSAGGDLAQTAMSNEDVYAAQNAMNIEINAMRQVYGLDIEINTMETNNRLSKINRNSSIAQSLIKGAGPAGMAGIS